MGFFLFPSLSLFKRIILSFFLSLSLSLFSRELFWLYCWLLLSVGCFVSPFVWPVCFFVYVFVVVSFCDVGPFCYCGVCVGDCATVRLLVGIRGVIENGILFVFFSLSLSCSKCLDKTKRFFLFFLFSFFFFFFFLVLEEERLFFCFFIIKSFIINKTTK